MDRNPNKNRSHPPLAGVLGYFDDPGALTEAMRRVRDARYRYFDAFTPYPIHGLEAAQGLKRSPLPYITFVAGLTGAITALGFQYWTSAVDWPLNVGGKPLFSWPAFVPVMFELTVLFGGLATVGAMFLLNGLPNMRRKAFDPTLTNDRFAILIEAPPVRPQSEEAEEDPEEEERRLAIQSRYKPFDEKEAAEFLQRVGARDVRSVYAEGWF